MRKDEPHAYGNYILAYLLDHKNEKIVYCVFFTYTLPMLWGLMVSPVIWNNFSSSTRTFFKRIKESMNEWNISPLTTLLPRISEGMGKGKITRELLSLSLTNSHMILYYYEEESSMIRAMITFNVRCNIGYSFFY